jgi:hypothetical protein
MISKCAAEWIGLTLKFAEPAFSSFSLKISKICSNSVEQGKPVLRKILSDYIGSAATGNVT